MPKVLPAIFSYEGMKEKWGEDNPDEPYSRREELQTGRYELNKWLIRVDDEAKTIATIGWKEHSNHTVVGGLLTTKKGYELGGNSRDLIETRQPQLPPNKPMVSAFGHRGGDNKRWMAGGRRSGWAFPNDPNFQQYSQLIPEAVLTDWLSEYPTNMGIKPNNAEDLAKAIYFDDIQGDWFNLTKEETHKIELGKKGYNVIELATSKRLNTIGLSMSQAKNMVQDLKDGKSVWEYIKPRQNRSWRDTLRKYLPDSSFEQYSLGEPVEDLGTRDRFKNKNIQSLGHIEQKAFVTEQYLRQVSDRLPSAGTSKMNDWLTKLNALNLSRGKYWFFGTNVYEDKTYVMINVINKGDRYLDTAKKFNLENMDSAIVFIGVSKEMVGKIKRGETIPRGRKFIDLWGKGGVRGLQKKAGRRFPKEPEDIFNKWENILKWRPDSSFNRTASKDGETLMGRYGPYKQSDSLSAYINTHYIDTGLVRFEETDFYERTDLMAEWIERLRERETELNSKNWIYCVEDEEEISYVEVHYRKNGEFSLERLKVDNEMEENPLVFNSARGRGAPDYPSYAKFIDIWNTGIKDSHRQGDEKNFFSMGDYSRKEEEANKRKLTASKLELWQPYSDEFDRLVEVKEKLETKLKNIKEGSMNQSTKDKKTLKMDDKIREIIPQIQRIYSSFLRDLRAAGYEVRRVR